MVRYFRTTLVDAMVRARGAERARTRVRRGKRTLERLVVLVLVLGASVRLFGTSGAKSDEESSSSSSSWTATEGRLRALKRDATACRVDAPTRLRALAERRRLFGWPDWRRERGGALSALAGDGISLKLKNAPRGAFATALEWYGFFATDPVLSEREADETRAHVLDVLRSSKAYQKDSGCLGKLANCEERFDLSLRLTKTVTRSMNKIISKLKPALVDIFGNDEAELVELSALVTCGGSPSQRLHTDADGVNGGDRLVSVFVSLQDTPVDLGPTQVFFNAPNPVVEFDLYSAMNLMRAVAYELNTTDAIREHGLADVYVDNGRVDIPEIRGITNGEMDFFHAHLRIDLTDNTVAFHPPWDESARLVVGVVGATRQGSALVYDSRTYHRGGQNTRGARVQLMFSFQSKRAFISGSTFTMRRRYQRIERVALSLTERATMRSLGQEFRTSPSVGAWILRVFGKIRLRDFPVTADTNDADRRWVDEDAVNDLDNTRDFDVDGLELKGAEI